MEELLQPRNLVKPNVLNDNSSILQKCFKAIGFPTNPIGKTIEILIYERGVKYDTITPNFEDLKCTPYKTIEDRMASVVTATSWLSGRDNERIVLQLFVTKAGGEERNKIDLSMITWVFNVNYPEMTLKPLEREVINDQHTRVYPIFNDVVLTVDNMLHELDTVRRIAVRILE